MVNSVSREIDGKTFQVSQLPAMQSVKMVPRLAKLLGPALRKIAEGDIRSLSNLNVSVIADALVGLVEHVDGAVIEELFKVFLQNALVDNKPLWPAFDLVFLGQPFTAYKVLAFAIEVNYQTFFDGLRARASVALAAAASRSVTSST